MIPREARPVFISSDAAVHCTEPGTYIVATTSANATVTLPTRYLDPASTGKVSPTPNAYEISVLPTAKAVIVAASGSDTISVGDATANPGYASFVLHPGETVTLIDDGGYWIPVWGTTTPALYRTVTRSSAATLTLNRQASLWVHTGTGATWTLPFSTENSGMEYLIKNRGSGAITLNPPGSDRIYTTADQTSINIAAGAAAALVSDNQKWCLLYNA